MVSTVGLIVGLTACGALLTETVIGLLSFYHSKKLQARLLAIAGLTIVFTGLLYLGPLAEFFSVLLYGSNLNPPTLLTLLSYTFVCPAIILAMYIGAELMMPEKKWYIVGIYTVLGVVFELFLWLDFFGYSLFGTGPIFSFDLETPGETLLDASFNRAHPAYLLVVIFLVSVFIFCGIGFLIKAKQATGELRRKFLYLGIGFSLFTICGVFDSLIAPGIWLIPVRVGMIVYAFLVYVGLKT